VCHALVARQTMPTPVALKLPQAARRCPNARACTYSYRSSRLHAFAQQVACHTYNATAAPVGAADGAWTVADGCVIARIARALRTDTDAPPNTTLEDTWLACYPQCSPGYRGLLCASCAPGFGRGQAPYSCARCPRPRSSALVLAAAFVLVVALLAYTIQSTLLPQTRAPSPGAAPERARSWWSQRFRSRLGGAVPPGAAPDERERGAPSLDESADALPHVASHAVAEAAEPAAVADATRTGSAQLVANPLFKLSPFASVDSAALPVPLPLEAARERSCRRSTSATAARRTRSAGKRASARAKSPASAAGTTAAGAQHAEEYQPRVEFQMAKIVISYMQVIAVVRDIELRLPAALQRLFQVQGSTSGLANLMAWDCLLLAPVAPARKAIGRVLIVLCLPLLFQGLCTAFWAAYFLWLKRTQRAMTLTLGGYTYHHVVVSALCVAFIFYPVVSSSILSIFNCITIVDTDGSATMVPFPVLRRNVGPFWSEDTDYRCWTGPHRRAALASAALLTTCACHLMCTDAA
jgi:hypothetical protein